MDDKRKELAGALTEVLFFMAFECYSEDKEQQERVLKLATAVRNAIDYLEGRD